KRLVWLGLTIDEKANAANGFIISARESRIAAHVIATDEEQIIADEALTVFGSG
ncbi:MAG: acetate/propionate family kinase, partial [Rhizobium leguminosarum]|nr:acetate/propionate family kinase [Rhizobium leguminosarum]